MPDSLIPFSNGEFRLYVDEHPADGFRVQAPGLARALGFRESYDLLRGIPEGEKGSELVRTPGGDQQCGYVTEAGFYRALGQRQAARIGDESLRERVERFQSWVYREVLPAIRKTGRYEVAQRFEIPASFAEALELAARQARELEAAHTKVAELEPSAEAWQYLVDADGDYSVRDAAQLLCRAGIDTGQKRLFAKLRELKWLDSQGRPYQAQIETGRMANRTRTYAHPRTGESTLTTQVRVTAKGVEWLMNHLPRTGLALVKGGAAS